MIITPEKIKELIEKLTDTNLTIKSRKREIVYYRYIAFKLSKELTSSSFTSIGKLYKKDHATVIHGINKFIILENQYDFKNAKNLYNRCLNILVPIPDEFKNIKPKKDIKEVIKYIYKTELTPIQKMVTGLKPSEEKELTDMIYLRKKSWNWKSKDKLTIYSGSY